MKNDLGHPFLTVCVDALGKQVVDRDVVLRDFLRNAAEAVIRREPDLLAEVRERGMDTQRIEEQHVAGLEVGAAPDTARLLQLTHQHAVMPRAATTCFDQVPSMPTERGAAYAASERRSNVSG